MTEEKEIMKLSVLLLEEDFQESAPAQSEYYQNLAEQEAAVRGRLFAKLDDRRAELLEELLRLRGQMEYERDLHYLRRGLRLGLEQGKRTKK